MTGQRANWAELAQQPPFDLKRGDCEGWLRRIALAQRALLADVAGLAASDRASPIEGLLSLKNAGAFGLSPFEATNQLAHFYATIKAAERVCDDLRGRVDFVHVQPTGTGLTKSEKAGWSEVDVTGMHEGEVVSLGEVSAASVSLKDAKKRKSMRKLLEKAQRHRVKCVHLYFLDRDGRLIVEAFDVDAAKD